MAAGGSFREFCKKLTCSLCLGFFNDPVSIADCGHKFCRACLTRRWGEAATEASCPQCNGRAQLDKLYPKTQLANFVEIAKRFRPWDGKEEEGEKIVCEKHQEPLELYCQEDKTFVCMVCERSKEHRHHRVIPLEEALPEVKCQTVIRVEERRLCEKHQETLKLYCKDDNTPICVVCIRSKEHRYHTVIPFEEAAQEYKDQIGSFLRILEKKKENLQPYNAQVITQSLGLLKITKAEKEKIVAEFQQLHQFLEQQEKLQLTRIEEMEKEIIKRKDEYLARLTEELSSLQGHIKEMEEKSQHAARELLQGTRSNLQSYEKKFEYPEAFPAELKWRFWELCDLHSFLESIMKQFKGTLISGPQKMKAANVILDADTANPELILSEDQKNVRLGKEMQTLPDNPKRFNRSTMVLGRDGFTSGQHFWEVTVGSENGWSIGVAKKSVGRKGKVYTGSDFGIWAVEDMGNGCKPCDPSLFPKVQPRRIQVRLNYDKGQVAFFDADTAIPIYTYSNNSFGGETLFPFFQICYQAHLNLSF